ncbi:hypothetical protein ACVFYP_23810 [Roseomonas sp. F4]
MRRFAFLALPLGLLLAQPVAAQHWNDAGPGRDLLSSTVTDFDSFRQRTPAAPSFSSESGPAATTQARGPIPLLDWVPPPPVPAVAPTTRRATNTARRTPRRAPVRRDVVRDTTPLPSATPARAQPTAQPGGDWERSLSERERELERLRRILEEDRLRYQQNRQPQLQ